MRSFLSLCGAVLVLAACDEVTEETVPAQVPDPAPVETPETAPIAPPAPEPQVTFVARNVEGATYNSDLDQIIFDRAGFDGFGVFVPTADDPVRGHRVFVAVEGQDANNYLALYKKTDGGGFETFQLANDKYVTVADQLFMVRRLEDTVPQAGYADYSGDFAGFVTEQGFSGGFFIVEGKVFLELDFEDSLIRGGISGIAPADGSTYDALPTYLILNRGVLDADGVGTEISVSVPGTGPIGTYSVMIGGDEGREAAGVLDTFYIDPDRELETHLAGVFTADAICIVGEPNGPCD